MPKCGSTFLQQVGFASHPEINLVWEPGPRLFFELRNNIDSADFNLADYSERLRGYVNEKRNGKQPHHKTVLSFEGFCGMLTTNRNDRRLATALFELFGRPKIIFIVREQYRVLFSLWGQYVKEGGRLGLRAFLNDPASPAQPGNPHENIYRRVQYGEYVAALIETFGSENVGLFFFEDFQADYEGFMRRLYRFIDVNTDSIPANRILWRGPNKNVADVFRTINRFFTTKQQDGLLPYSFYLRYRRWFQRRIFGSQRWNPSRRFDTRSLVAPCFQEQIAQSNRELATLVDRDVGKLGYEL